MTPSPSALAERTTGLDNPIAVDECPSPALRVLVVIASYGTKNLGFLEQLVKSYQSMPFAVDLVVVSEGPKEVAGVRVVVGLPSPNPWSLPFAHKALFAETIDRYDLFIYSEDDILITERNVRAFANASKVLGPDEVAGFLRFEEHASGAVWMPDAHSSFHWDPRPVKRGEAVFAEFSNEHSACYMLTQAQLRTAIASGGFLVEPYEDKYDMLCAAATDPYTQCGLRRLVCVSDPTPFLVHHLSNRYVGQMGLTLDAFRQQLETVQRISERRHPATVLCRVDSRLPRTEFGKSYYEPPHEAVVAMAATARTVLSVGCGWGATEARLIAQGAHVTALPLDSVIGAVAERAGVEAVYGSLDGCFAELDGRVFDCVLISNVLHLQPDPERIVSACAHLVAPGGTLVVDSPNFAHPTAVAKKRLRLKGMERLADFALGGVTVIGPAHLSRWTAAAGLRAPQVRWAEHVLPKPLRRVGVSVALGRLTATKFLFQARRATGENRARA